MKKTSGKYEIIVNRTEAIKKAIELATKKDIIVLAGIGHETHQDINHVITHYDEREEIKKIIDEKLKNKKD